jgi:hypothetical protein
MIGRDGRRLCDVLREMISTRSSGWLTTDNTTWISAMPGHRVRRIRDMEAEDAVERFRVLLAMWITATVM